jgi:glycosyltransferase involved in cell wall biosynthesis
MSGISRGRLSLSLYVGTITSARSKGINPDIQELEVQGVGSYVMAHQHSFTTWNRQVNILYIVSAFPRYDGDVITPWLSETIHRLRHRGVGVDVLAPSYRGLRDHCVSGLTVHRFRYAPSQWETLTHDQTAPDRIRERPRFLAALPTYVVSGSIAATRLARSGKYDVIHAFWPIPHGILALIAKYGSGIPVVCTFFGVELTWIESQLTVLRPVLRWIVRESDCVTAISSHTAALVRRSAPETTPTIIPFGAATSVVASGRPRSATSRHEDGFLRLLFVGRLVQRKGVDVLLRAIACAPTTDRLSLWVVGDGPERRSLEALAAALGVLDRVAFFGFVSREELEDRYTECDVVVLPAVVDAKGDTEGLGVVLLEGSSHGKPVIASEAGGIVDIVRPGETGLLVPPGDVNALAAAIEALRADPERAAMLGRAGKRHVEREFSWSTIIDRLELVYRQAVSGQRGPPSGHLRSRTAYRADER